MFADHFRRLLTQNDPARTGRAGALWVMNLRTQLVGPYASNMPLGVAVTADFEPMRAVLASECTALLEGWAQIASEADRKWLRGGTAPAAPTGPGLRFIFPASVKRRKGVLLKDLDGVEPEDDGGLFEGARQLFAWMEDVYLLLRWSSTTRSLTCEVHVEVKPGCEQAVTDAEVARLGSFLVLFWEVASERDFHWIEPTQSEGRFDEPPNIVVKPEILRQERTPSR